MALHLLSDRAHQAGHDVVGGFIVHVLQRVFIKKDGQLCREFFVGEVKAQTDRIERVDGNFVADVAAGDFFSSQFPAGSLVGGRVLIEINGFTGHCVVSESVVLSYALKAVDQTPAAAERRVWS